MFCRVNLEILSSEGARRGSDSFNDDHALLFCEGLSRLYGKGKMKIPYVILLIVSFGLLSGIGVPPTARCSTESAKTIIFTDAFGKQVEIAGPAQRIVIINGDAAEILCALGAEQNIVGISTHIAEGTELFTGLEGKTVVGSSTGPSLEKIIELQPDLVIAYEMWMSEEAFEAKLKPLGIPVARMYCYRLDRLEEEIKTLGRIVGKNERAAAYADYFHDTLSEVEKRLERLQGKKVRLYNESYGPYKTISDNSGHEAFLHLAGVENIAAGQPVRFPEITAEWVVEKDPEVIVKVASSTYVKTGYGVKDVQAIDVFRNELMRRPVWQQITAVKNDQVHVLSNELYVGPRMPLGVLYLAKWAYPDRFTDIDPQELHRQWLRKWHNKELEGIYVYP